MPRDVLRKVRRLMSAVVPLAGVGTLRMGGHVISRDYYYITSYPKSGNTWVRFLIAHVLAGQEGTLAFRKIGEFVPDSHRKQDREFIEHPESLFNRLSTKFVKTHAAYSPEFMKAIYIVRDGRDVVTSLYYWLNARKDKQVLLSDIIRGNIGYGLWSEHVRGWVDGRCQKKLIIRYEDLLEDSGKCLRNILRFADLECEEQRIIQAVENSSFESMQRSERDYGLFDGSKEVSKVMPFVRKGVTGDWKHLFAEEDTKLFWKYHRLGMETLNYGE